MKPLDLLRLMIRAAKQFLALAEKALREAEVKEKREKALQEAEAKKEKKQ